MRAIFIAIGGTVGFITFVALFLWVSYVWTGWAMDGPSWRMYLSPLAVLGYFLLAMVFGGIYYKAREGL